jgi:hypothetical protein
MAGHDNYDRGDEECVSPRSSPNLQAIIHELGGLFFTAERKSCSSRFQTYEIAPSDTANE